jgi:hypothetical protein
MTRVLRPEREMRVLVGVAAQPLVAAAVAFLAFPVLLLDGHGQTLGGGAPTSVADAAVSVAVGAGLVALAVTLVGALPTALWLMKRRRVSLPEALAFGLAFGNAPFLIGALLAGTYGLAGFIRGVAFSSLLGVAGAAVFWWIALRERGE